MEVLYQIFGWMGTIMIVSAYFLVSAKKVDGRSVLYQLLNFFGAIGVFVNVFHQQAWPAAVLQVVWAIIAVTALLKRKPAD